jgi:hypothetical protein
MQVTPILDRNDPSRSYVRVNDIPAVFPKHTDTPEVGIPVEVMITGVHYHEDADGNFDTARPKMLFIRPITDYYIEVQHSGFHQSTKGPTARFITLDKILTPGRVDVYVANDPNLLVMATAYIRRKDIDRSIIRIEGVPNLEDLFNPTSFY